LDKTEANEDNQTKKYYAIIVIVILIILGLIGYSWITGSMIVNLKSPFFEVFFKDPQPGNVAVLNETLSENQRLKSEVETLKVRLNETESENQHLKSEEEQSRAELKYANIEINNLRAEVDDLQEKIYNLNDNGKIVIPKVKINNPGNGQEVPNWITVHGTIDGSIPDNNYLWLLVGLEPEQQWWPQTGNIKPTGQDWEIRARIGGGVNLSIGLEYKILAILVNEKVNEDFNNWLEKGKQEENYPPMEFPDGTILDKISVIKVEG
jgi:hypothetical protein